MKKLFSKALTKAAIEANRRRGGDGKKVVLEAPSDLGRYNKKEERRRGMRQSKKEASKA